jgi:predicted dehydrogenase
MEPRVKIGIVGVGKMGGLHLNKFSSLSDVQVCGIYDPNEQHARAAHEKYGVPVFQNLADLLFESDAISIASPTNTHYRIARQAFESGVHVLVEKPATETVEEAQELVRLADQKKLVFQVGFLERLRFANLCEGIDLQHVRYIEGYRLAPSPGRESAIDVVSDLMIHDLDLVLSLNPEEPSMVSAIGVPVLTSLVDLANVRLEFPSGAVANLSASRVSMKPERKFRLFTLNTYASVDLMANRASIQRCNKGTDPKGSGIEHRVVEFPSIDALKDQCLQFADCVRNRKQPLVTGRDGLKALRYAKIIKDKIFERAAWRVPGQEIESAFADSPSQA